MSRSSTLCGMWDRPGECYDNRVARPGCQISTPRMGSKWPGGFLQRKTIVYGYDSISGWGPPTVPLPVALAP